MFFTELKNFSRENFWVYILLFISLLVVYLTGKGNLLEIILLFLANLLGNLFIMVMQSNYTAKNNKIGAIYHVSATLVFTLISIYGLVLLNQSQYIIWQIAYLLAAIKAFNFYNYSIDLKVINSATLGGINLILLALFIYFSGKEINVYGLFDININANLGSIIMAIGFSLVTTGLVSTNDIFRYWFNLFGIFGIVFGSGVLIYNSYFVGSLDGIALGYFILTSTVFVYYLKLLKKYIS